MDRFQYVQNLRKIQTYLKIINIRKVELKICNFKVSIYSKQLFETLNNSITYSLYYTIIHFRHPPRLITSLRFNSSTEKHLGMTKMFKIVKLLEPRTIVIYYSFSYLIEICNKSFFIICVSK